MRIILGFIVAPLASGLLQGLIVGNWPAVFMALVFAYRFTLVLGLPTFLIFRRFRWLKAWHAMTAGFGLGMVAPLLRGMSTDFGDYSAVSIVGSLGLFALHGMAVSTTFWLIALINQSGNARTVSEA